MNRVRYRWLRARDLNLHLDFEERMITADSLLRYQFTPLANSSKSPESRPVSGRVPNALQAFGLLAKTCAPPLFHVEMEMILVGFIGTRAKHRAEGFAGFIVHGIEKIPLTIDPANRYPLDADCFARYPPRVWQWQRRIGSPFYHADLLARSQHEIGDVDGIGKCMFAQGLIGTAIAVTASIRTRVQLDDRHVEQGLRLRLNGFRVTVAGGSMAILGSVPIDFSKMGAGVPHDPSLKAGSRSQSSETEDSASTQLALAAAISVSVQGMVAALLGGGAVCCVGVPPRAGFRSGSGAASAAVREGPIEP